MTTPAYDPAPFGKELVNSALTGAGVGTSAMALYYLLNGLHTAKVPANLLREPAPTKKPTAVPDKEARSGRGESLWCASRFVRGRREGDPDHVSARSRRV